MRGNKIELRIKRITPRPRVIRHITLRRLNKRDEILVGTIVGSTVLRDSKRDRNEGSLKTETGYRQAETEHRHIQAEHRQPEAVGSGEMLRKEMEEINNWARLGLQLYFGWFALQFTVNGIAVGWLFTRTGTLPWFARLVFLLFILWNLMGMIVTVLLYNSLTETDRRIKRVIETMVNFDRIEDPWFHPRSPMPGAAIRVVFIFCVGTMLISLLFWILLFVAGT